MVLQMWEILSASIIKGNSHDSNVNINIHGPIKHGIYLGRTRRNAKTKQLNWWYKRKKYPFITMITWITNISGSCQLSNGEHKR